MSDIDDRKHEKKVVIERKTGARRLPLVVSVPHINKWLDDHPNPAKDAPLWCKIQQSQDDQLGYRYIRDKILRKTMDEAGIDKPSNPHHYRYSYASYLANHLEKAQLCAWFGWVQGSDDPVQYVHLSGRHIDNAYDEIHRYTSARRRAMNHRSASEALPGGQRTRSRVLYALWLRAVFEVEEDMKQDYADTPPGDISTKDKTDIIDNFLAGPEVKTALLN